MAEVNTSAPIASMRVSYEDGSLDEALLADTWHEQFRRWFDDAVRAGVVEPNAMVLATADADGTPSSRTVLCKGFDERGLVFFTNYTSAKSHDMMVTNVAAATFPWFQQQRQVNISGTVEKVRPEETADYWVKRPRGSQLGAWASPQSRVVSGRAALESALHGIERRFADAEHVPVPRHWGGWRILPDMVEFWQGRADRLHDRLRFRWVNHAWLVERLAP